MEAAALSNYADIAAQNVGAALIVTGTVVLTPEAKQPPELKATEITVEEARPLRTIPCRKSATVWSSCGPSSTCVPGRTCSPPPSGCGRGAYAIHQFFQERGFVYVHTPIITASDCEGAGEMFRVTTLDPENPPQGGRHRGLQRDFFGKPANLTVSGQLNAENFAMAFGDVYTFGPTFRAENSNTQRHAAEFWMIEPEMAFCDLKGRHGRGGGDD